MRTGQHGVKRRRASLVALSSSATTEATEAATTAPTTAPAVTTLTTGTAAASAFVGEARVA